MMRKNYYASSKEYGKKLSYGAERESAKKDLEENIKWKKKMTKFREYIKKLMDTDFSFSINGFEHCSYKSYMNTISNVLMVPIKKINIDDGNKIESFIEIKGILVTGEELENIIVPLNDIETKAFYINPYWGLKVIFEQQAKKVLQIKSIKILSESIPQETIYKFTGLTKVNDKTVFLHNGGAIGTKEPIRVELDDEILKRYKFTDKEFDIKETLKISLSCLEVAPKIITMPLLCFTFFAPLTSLFEEIGIPIGYLLYVVGEQQSKKSSIVTAFSCHFGDFDKNHVAMRFLDKPTNIAEKCSILKDVVIVCDDYYPAISNQEMIQMQETAEGLTSLCADRTSGGRSKSNGQMRKTYRAKGQVIGTGEIIPKFSASRLSRMLIVEIKRGDIKNDKLKYIQNNIEQLQYTMKKYIENLINNKKEIKNKIKSEFDKRANMASENGTSKFISFRTAEKISSLYVSFLILMDFALENNVITEEEKEKKLEECWNTLIELAKKQNEIAESSTPIEMIINAIEVLSSTNKLATIEYESAKYTKITEISKNDVIGFYDKKENMHLVYPDLLYKAIRRFYNEQGKEFPLDKSAMCKELMLKGYLYKTEKQERPQIRRNNPRSSREETFIGILEDKIHITYRYNHRGIILEV